MVFYAARTDNAFIIALLACVPWFPTEWETNVIFICAEPGAQWETIKLLRCSIAWAKARNCTTWRIASDTHIDTAPLAKRVGATEIAPRWVVQMKPTAQVR